MERSVRPSAPHVGVLFLGRKRPGFDQDWGNRMTGRVRSAIEASTIESFEPGRPIVDEASLTTAVKACVAEGVDAILTLQTTMSDARLARTLCQEWPEPIILWATPEKPDGSMISSNSLVGTHNWASNLYHYGRGFEVVYGSPERPEIMEELKRAILLLTAKRRLNSSKLGVVATTGMPPPERFEKLVHEGMPHHVAVFRGRNRETLRRFADKCSISFIE